MVNILAPIIVGDYCRYAHTDFEFGELTELAAKNKCTTCESVRNLPASNAPGSAFVPPAKAQRLN